MGDHQVEIKASNEWWWVYKHWGRKAYRSDTRI